MEQHDRWIHWIKDAGVNVLGGVFKHSKPIPKEVREKIVQLAIQGVRNEQIARDLKITDGCICGILKKYYQTGSIEPTIRKNKGRNVLTPLVMHAIHKYKSENPAISARQIGNNLLNDTVCDGKNVPSISSINNWTRKSIFGKSYK